MTVTIDHREFEESMASLAPVVSVRVGGDGPRIERIHIIATPDVPSETVVGGVRSLAWDRFGVVIDSPAISVTQIVRTAP